MPWEIERIELLSYDGCDNRWQMFQKVVDRGAQTKGTSTAIFFRDQISGLLDTSISALEKLELRINPSGQPERVDVRLRDVAIRTGFIDYCKHRLVDGGQPSSLVDWEKLKTGDSVVMDRATVREFLPILPVGRDWDIIGRLHLAAPAIDPSFWRRFFVYEVRFEQPPPNDPRPPNQPPSGDYVFLRIKGAKLEAGVENGVLESPYFDFAKNPANMAPHERELYYLYSDVIDPIQKTNANDSYYAVWPIIACGYYHFVQLKLTKPKGIGGDALESCYSSVPEAIITQGKLSYLVFKESLRELLVQIRLSAFQQRVTEWITDHGKEILASPIRARKLAIECFCSLAPMINEMSAIVWGDRVWAHVWSQEVGIGAVLQEWRTTLTGTPDSVRMSGPIVTQIRVGEAKWLDHGDYCRDTIQTGEDRIEVWLFLKRPPGEKPENQPFHNECFRGTNMGRLQEQFDVVRQRVLRVHEAGGR